MKIQLSFEIGTIEEAIRIAGRLEEHVDIFSIGTLLLQTHGIAIIEQFHNHFPKKTILADAKILSPDPSYITLYSSAQADWVSVMASSGNATIHTLCLAAHAKGIKVQLNLSGASAPEQSAMEAKKLGVDALLVSIPFEQKNMQQFLDQWELVKGNSTVPLYLSTNFSENNIAMLKTLNLYGAVITVSDTKNTEESLIALCDGLQKD